MTGGGRTAGGAGDRAALDRLLGVPEMAWLVERVRSRVIAAQGRRLSGAVRLDRPTPEQRAAAVRLVGRPRRSGASLRIDLADVEQVLRRGPWPAGLADAVEAVGGPVVDTQAERAHEAAEWDRVRHLLDSAIERRPGLRRWWDSFCADGGLKKAARAEAKRLSRPTSPDVAATLVRAVADVLECLPAPGEPRSVLARRVVGDAHALDLSRPLGRVAAAAVGAAFRPESAGHGRDSSVRDSWAAAGVVLSSVASTALCLGVRGVDDEAGASPLARATSTALEAMRGARAPILLTLDQVRSGGVQALPAGGVVHVCENPTVVEVVAERWARGGPSRVTGVDGPLLVCASGQPSTAVIELLRRLTVRGAECRYHGDFDWAGLRIARFLGTQVAWTPWRYTAADYAEAVTGQAPSLDLTGRPAESSWDPGLAIFMAEHGLAIEEEAIADQLASDLLA